MEAVKTNEMKYTDCIEVKSGFPERDPAAEAFKKLRTNILFAGEDVKTVAITSCRAKEGKSSIAFELALGLAGINKKTVFVDADMRRSALADRIALRPDADGLSQYLAGLAGKEKVLYATQNPDLFLIPSGHQPANPVELLNSERFSDLIKELREEFDYVIIDTPALGDVIDAAVIAGIADGVLLVVESGLNHQRPAQKVMEQLTRADCRILGAVINNAKKKSIGYNLQYFGRSIKV